MCPEEVCICPCDIFPFVSSKGLCRRGHSTSEGCFPALGGDGGLGQLLLYTSWGVWSCWAKGVPGDAQQGGCPAVFGWNADPVQARVGLPLKLAASIEMSLDRFGTCFQTQTLDIIINPYVKMLDVSCDGLRPVATDNYHILSLFRVSSIRTTSQSSGLRHQGTDQMVIVTCATCMHHVIILPCIPPQGIWKHLRLIKGKTFFYWFKHFLFSKWQIHNHFMELTSLSPQRWDTKQMKNLILHFESASGRCLTVAQVANATRKRVWTVCPCWTTHFWLEPI